MTLWLLSSSQPRNDSTNYTPRWSPDGKFIVFARRDKPGQSWYLVKMNADGGNVSPLSRNDAHDDREPGWMGGEILFDSIRDGNRDIYVMDGDKQRRLTHDKAEDKMAAASPDGTKVVFVSNRTGAFELWMMNADGSGPRQLTRDSFANTVPRLVWSRDGEWIAFASTRVENKEGKRQIFIIRPDGSGLRALNDLSFDANQRWMPDGRSLIFDANPDGSDVSSTNGWEIMAMRSDGTKRRRLTRNRVNDWGPDPSPDGKHIAYCSGTNNQYEIWVMRADGSAPKRLTRLVHP